MSICGALIEAEESPKARDLMVSSCNKVAFQIEAKRENLKSLDTLIKLTPNKNQRDEMLHRNNDAAFKSEAVATFLAVTLGDKEGRAYQKNSLNEGKILKLRELKKSLTRKFSNDESNHNNVRGLVNGVLIDLIREDGLCLVGEDKMNLDDAFEKSRFTKRDCDEVSAAIQRAKFTDLSVGQKEIVHGEMVKLFAPRSPSPAYCFTKEARALMEMCEEKERR